MFTELKAVSRSFEELKQEDDVTKGLINSRVDKKLLKTFCGERRT